MTILGKMASLSLTPKHLSESDQHSIANFEEFIHNRGKSGRAASLALPNNSLLDLYDKQQEQCRSVALLPINNSNVVVRRHSSHCCPMLDGGVVGGGGGAGGVPPPAAAGTDANLQLDAKPHQQQSEHNSTVFIGDLKQFEENEDNKLNPLPPPPPVPKRTFRGKAAYTKNNNNNNDNICTADKSIVVNNSSSHFNFQPIVRAPFSPPLLCNLNDLPRQYIIDPSSVDDDDRMSLENSVFDEPTVDGGATTTTTTEGQPKSMHLSTVGRRSYRSSSDSNRSHATTDTGYVSSSNGSDKNSIEFRSRFSSVDTQSSLDSCLTEKTIDSPLSKESFKIDSGRSSAMNEYNNNSSRQTSRGLPTVPIRKQFSVPPKIPPPQQQQQQQQQHQQTNAKRPIPPTPPIRSQQSFESSCSSSQSQLNNQTVALAARPSRQEEYSAKPLAIRNKFGKKTKPPPIVYPKLHQRQDSSISSDSYSITSSPGYNSKSMEAPLLQYATKINKNGIRHQDSNDSFVMTASRYGGGGMPMIGKCNARQDSNLSSDSFSQTSSPGYNTKTMEAPLLPSMKRFCNVVPAPNHIKNEIVEEQDQLSVPTSPITKSVSTPASLQTIVRFQNGQPNMANQHHTIIHRRKSSNPYITQGRLKFRLFQVLLNALALLAIAGGLAAYFNAYPTIKFINKTIITSVRVDDVPLIGKNPAPGICLPIIVKFCQGPQIPYNYTVFPNYIGHFGQMETQVDLEAYDALVDVRCYELVSLFLCSLFVPKCGASGSTVPPCETLCTETLRRCGFFFDVFGLSLPDYLNCNLFKDFDDPEECVGLQQVREVMMEARNPKCNGFLCDQTLCIPNDYVCDGHLDCMDQTDESACDQCDSESIYCGDNRCMSRKHICDGINDCPHGQDERNCIRLSERNGDLGKGVLEVYKIDSSGREWIPACVKNWDRSVSPSTVCSMLGYSSVNATTVVTKRTHRPLLATVDVSRDIWRMYAKKRSNLMKEFSGCKAKEDYPIAELTCANFECGRVRTRRYKPARRIIGGDISNPGDWPFLAAILGGPEKIFYCAGVLIADQWILTASHCIGNHSLRDISDWTVQLGVTRRNSHTYYGQTFKVKAVISHPQYNLQIAHDNDIALFQLASRVSFHEHLLPVCLPPPELKELRPGQKCTVIGWGKSEDRNPKATYEPIVNEVEVPVVRREQCDQWLDNLTVSEGMICAGYEEGGKDACQGDSGGPLLCRYPGERDKWFVGGIVSWGIMCANPKLPGVYANVIKYIPWILEEMANRTDTGTEPEYSGY